MPFVIPGHSKARLQSKAGTRIAVFRKKCFMFFLSSFVNIKLIISSTVTSVSTSTLDTQPVDPYQLVGRGVESRYYREIWSNGDKYDVCRILPSDRRRIPSIDEGHEPSPSAHPQWRQWKVGFGFESSMLRGGESLTDE